MSIKSGDIELLSICVDKSDRITRCECWQYNVADQFPVQSTSEKNGRCILDVGPPHQGCTIDTFVDNSIISGKSKIMSQDNIILAKLFFSDGIAEGSCILYDDLGRVFFKGLFKDGYRTGRGKEYDENGIITFDGFFEKGKRMNIYPSDKMNGFWKEYDENENLISMSQRNQMGKMHGLSFFYSEDGRVSKISKWRNGEEVQVKILFSGNTMIEYRKGVKRYEGCFREDANFLYLYEGEGTLYKRDGETIQYQGSFHNGVRHGRGSYYDCFQIKHDRYWNNGLPRSSWFFAFLYLIVAYWLYFCWLSNRYNTWHWLVFLFYYIFLLPASVALLFMPFIIFALYINKDSDSRFYSTFYKKRHRNISLKSYYFGLNIKTFIPPQYNFESIAIGNRCFLKANLFRINGLQQLKTLIIGANSFSAKVSCIHPSDFSFHIINCAELESIEIGKRSFRDYYGQFELYNLPALQSVTIGSLHDDSSNFMYSSFVLQGMCFFLVFTRSSITKTCSFRENGF